MVRRRTDILAAERRSHMTWKWTSRPSGGGVGAFMRQSRAAHSAALEAVANAARARAPKRSGEYAASIRATEGIGLGTHLTGSVGSHLPQAGAVERGANVGARRGPHMRGQPSIRPAAIAAFGRSFEARFR